MKPIKPKAAERLRAFLPAFGDKLNFATLTAVGQFLGKEPRTVEAYLSRTEDRFIASEEYQRIITEWVKWKNRKQVDFAGVRYIVLDENGDQLFECYYKWAAVYLADIEGHSIIDTYGVTDFVDEALSRRSRLRQIVRAGIVPLDQICDVLKADRITVYDYMVEKVDWVRTPDERQLKMLEAYQASLIGEAA